MRSFSDMWYDPVARKKILIFGGGGLAFVILLIIIIVVATSGKKTEFRGRDALSEVPLIDGHNNLPTNLFLFENNILKNFDFTSLTGKDLWANVNHTDLPRLRDGKVGGQFWVAQADCTATNYVDAVARTLEQIDVIKRLVDKYKNDMQFATSVDDIWQSFWNGKIASLIGVGGGHAIDSRMAVLRMYYELGVRYMTLTDDCETPWSETRIVENSTSTPGLTLFGKDVIREMNRIGMMVDISHTSTKVISDTLETSVVPVIFSHSAAASVTNVTLNIDDDTLLKLKTNNGIIMINFGSDYVNRNNDINNTTANITDVIEHLNHIKEITGSSEYVGIGASFGVHSEFPKELNDVATYPELFDQLAVNKWSRQDLINLAGANLLRVMKAVDDHRKELMEDGKEHTIYENPIPEPDIDGLRSCRSNVTAT